MPALLQYKEVIVTLTSGWLFEFECVNIAKLEPSSVCVGGQEVVHHKCRKPTMLYHNVFPCSLIDK